MLRHCKKENQNRRHPFWCVCCWHIHPWCGICCLEGHKTCHTKCITKQRHMHRLGRLRCRRKLCQTPGQLNETHPWQTSHPNLNILSKCRVQIIFSWQLYEQFLNPEQSASEGRWSTCKSGRQHIRRLKRLRAKTGKEMKWFCLAIKSVPFPWNEMVWENCSNLRSVRYNFVECVCHQDCSPV